MDRFKTSHSACLLIAGVVASSASIVHGQENHARFVSTTASTSDTKPESGAETNSEIAAPDVYLRVANLHHDIDLIRLEMGKPKIEPLKLRVSNASSREAFFQAVTLFRKTDILGFELTRERVDIHPDDVAAAVDAASARLLSVKTYLSITDGETRTTREDSKTFNDVFLAIVEANRQLNLLLAQPYSPSDVFQQVTQGVSYASELVRQLPGATRMPDTPAFQHRKRPVDVYRRLIGCFKQVRQIARRSGIDTMDFDTLDPDLPSVTPSDVYDIASLVVSELAYLHSRLDTRAPAHTAQSPGHKLPSHVYQRAGLLEAQLTGLSQLVDSSPNWLQEATKER